MDKVEKVVELLSASGVLSERLPGFKVRKEQLEMAAQVAQAILDKESVVVEAGTGTGKTLAYLVPAMSLGGKVLISTGTRNLQNQLYHKDLPLVRNMLDRPLTVALLKGRSNYLCTYHLEQNRFIKHMLTRHQSRQLSKIEYWAQSTATGDISELAELPESDAVWGFATSNTDNCLGQDCPHIDDCFLNKARQAALNSDVVVINHHLFFADAIMRDEGFGELLPSADVVILDEAHQLTEVASRFFGMTLSSRKIHRLCSDLEAEVRESASDMNEMLEAVSSLELAVEKIQRAFTSLNVPEKGAWWEIAQQASVVSAIADLGKKLNALAKLVGAVESRSRGLQSCNRRLTELLALYRVIGEQSSPVSEEVSGSSDKGMNEADETDRDLASHYIQWYERYRNSFALHLTPLTIDEPFNLYRNQFDASWIFTSATLTVNQRFDSFTRPLGLDSIQQVQLASPFDYAKQACLYIPEGLPKPQDPDFTASVVKMAIPLLQKTGGRAFLLFTSHAALQQAAEMIRDQIDFPLLIQGDMGKSELLRQFRELGTAVLLGTGDFWEGVDVRGAALSCVIIDKLPFASPSDPVVKAKIEHIKKQGGNPFMEYQVPSAAIGLKQGVGRLIRDHEDRGLMVICDNRLVNSRYGAVFLRSLPPMPLTREWSTVVEFIEQNLGYPSAGEGVSDSLLDNELDEQTDSCIGQEEEV